MRGKFITIEGCEGAGKSRQMRELAAYLEKKGVDVLVTREPGGNPISEQIRTVILAGKNTAMCDECEALLYAASRIQHLTETVIPAIKAGKTVLCDRFVHSSLAYQGYARGLGFEYVEQINQKAMDECMPDCTLFLDISPRQAFIRKGGVDKNDRVELAGEAFHQRVYEGYKKLLERYPMQMVAIDPSGAVHQTTAKIIEELQKRRLIP
ncbi:MAG: dTMP kinase [Clostridia bacterium]|nr:dTMP kinase [Clostridia bacterium]MBQ1942040.1 dTMP kinase [Clostridia bacterium]MBQ5801660.1 dTMP kinase [Clostridia bacterium]